MTGVISEIRASELTGPVLGKLINEKKSFKVYAIANMAEAVALVEKYVEAYGLRCRVYTEYRAAALAGEVLAGGVGVAAAVGIAVHNLATWNPDYEVGKDYISNALSVIYKKQNH